MVKVVVVVMALLAGGCSAVMCPEGTELASNPGTYGVWQCVEIEAEGEE